VPEVLYIDSCTSRDFRDLIDRMHNDSTLATVAGVEPRTFQELARSALQVLQADDPPVGVDQVLYRVQLELSPRKSLVLSIEGDS
jgi:hypothetical protein